ncbi:serine/threonine-protein phosphatase 7 long form homolog [Beta vulgaris subsp. vulgaris]|uniref:serine/threonine-protein phosphatase 7 long form homolog n=1 Tax=Beta vulgaris subsp. vulgaris TaxID=3555 RepID=UPI0025486F7D|nr:serine/threonine-protein phosphatase 7 long form homolog [Beta vulgaris subsp. vulgaris]
MTWNVTGSLTVASEFEIGQEFASLQQLKNFVKAWSISRNQMFRVLESEPTNNCLGDITCGDHPLISSDFVADLIEDFIRTDPSFNCWGQETHTFHLTVGEATITLEDVAVILGLRVHGAPVTGRGEGNWAALVFELLGIWPNTPENEPKVLQGSSLRLTWLRQHFFLLPNDADEVTVQRFARAYILALMGSILFADKSGDAVQVLYLPLLADLDVAGTYSWGSATLAYLYRQLCRASHRGARELGGPVLLLQIWAWEHIHIGRPRISRVRDPPPQFDEAVPILGSQHVPGIDPLAVSWLRVHISRSHTAGGLPYYRDALDHQTDEQVHRLVLA